METRAHYVAVGAFVLAIIVLGFVAVLSLGRVEFAQELKRYYIFFKGSVTGLSKGAFVQYNGITVGRVVDVRVDPDDLEKIQVTVEIDTNLVNIKTDARAFVDTNLLSGVATIQIRGGTREARNLEPEPGHRYPVIASGSSVLQRVTETGPQLLDRLMVTVDNLNAVLSEQNRKAVSDSLQNMRTITEAFVAPSQEVNELVANANAAVIGLKSLLDHVDESYASRGGLRDEALKALSDFDRLAKGLIDTNKQLQQVLQENRPGLQEFTHSTLTQVSNLVSDMQRLIAGLTRFVASVERDPARLLFGERREGYRPQ
ncbi:MAG: MlaD family protein [Stellaceae bacterium]|jgi:phospholipid/cholesterol/gamma-HCH transport system substrate-binding protein